MQLHCPAKCRNSGRRITHKFLRVSQFFGKLVDVLHEFLCHLPASCVPEHSINAVNSLELPEVLHDDIRVPEVIQNLERLSPVREVGIVLEDALADCVERPDEHCSCVCGDVPGRELLSYAGTEFLGGLVGEGCEHYRGGVYVLLLDEEHCALNYRVCLARSRPGNHEQGTACAGYGFLLSLVCCPKVEVGEVLRQEAVLFISLRRRYQRVVLAEILHQVRCVLAKSHYGLVGLPKVCARKNDDAFCLLSVEACGVDLL